MERVPTASRRIYLRLRVFLQQLQIDRRKREAEALWGGKKSEAQVIHNIRSTDDADVLTMEADEVGMERMRLGLVPSWAKGSTTALRARNPQKLLPPNPVP